MGCACVTGATSGIGEEICWQLAAAGHNLVIVARHKDALDGLADALRNTAGVNVEVLCADLAHSADVAQVAERLSVSAGESQGRSPVGLLVNNAGFGLKTCFMCNDIGSELYGLDVMVRAVMVLSHAALDTMIPRNRGAILNVASVAADTGMGTYSAHKAWVRAFTEGLAVGLKGTGVTATVVCPGLTHTAFHDTWNVDMSAIPEWAWTSREQVASDALKAVSRGQVIVTPSLRYKIAAAAMRYAPRWVTRAIVSRIPHT